MNYCMAIAVFAFNALAHCGYVPSLQAHYSVHNGNAHAFLISLAWDFDDYGANPFMHALEIQRLERETHLLMQQRHEIDEDCCE